VGWSQEQQQEQRLWGDSTLRQALRPEPPRVVRIAQALQELALEPCGIQLTGR